MLVSKIILCHERVQENTKSFFSDEIEVKVSRLKKCCIRFCGVLQSGPTRRARFFRYFDNCYQSFSDISVIFLKAFCIQSFKKARKSARYEFFRLADSCSDKKMLESPAEKKSCFFSVNSRRLSEI